MVSVSFCVWCGVVFCSVTPETDCVFRQFTVQSQIIRSFEPMGACLLTARHATNLSVETHGIQQMPTRAFVSVEGMFTSERVWEAFNSVNTKKGSA